MKCGNECEAPEAHVSDSRWPVLLALCTIIAAALAAYHNAFSAPLLLDDLVTIKANPSIRNLGHLRSVFFPPHNVFSAGRPFLNLTFALNYAAGGLSVRSYHALNLLIHVLAGIALFGIVRATLSLPDLKERWGRVATLLALAVAVVWTVHPAQTESVTYISQRAESLMGLFYLLTLYFFIRATLSPAPGFWAALSVAACLFGMMTKEVMVSAPLIVLLYDRAFIAGSFREAWRQHRRIYLGLAATWLVLAGLMTSSSLRGRGVGYGPEFAWQAYALTESKVVVDYLKLALWPHPLVFDYGPNLRVNTAAEAAPYVILLLLLLSLVLFALRRWPQLGFLGAWFFVILAPSSSVVPVIGQPMAENRLYLPLAAIVTLEFVGLYAWAGWKGLLIGFPALAIFFGILTTTRNRDYRDAIAIWDDTILKCPENSRAHDNLGNALAEIPGHLPDAMAHFEAALKINPDDAEAHNNLGNALAKTPGGLPEAIAHYEAALRIKPDHALAHNDLGIAFAKTPGRLSDAIMHFEAALRINPDFAEAQSNLGNALTKVPGRLPDAIAHYEAALKIDPDDPIAHDNLGIVLVKIPGRLPEAIAQFEAALKAKPNFAEAHSHLGNALSEIPDRLPEAIAQLDLAVKINPDYGEGHNNLGNALAKIPERLPDAIVQFEAALRTDPDDPSVHNNLGIALARTPGHLTDAISHLDTALRIDPDYAEAHFNLGNVLLAVGGRDREAWTHFAAALRLRPDWEPMVARLRTAQP